jgi:hypothetical protein
VCDRPATNGLDVEDDGRESRCSNLDLVRAGREFQVLEDPVEVVHDSGVVPVDVDLCVAWRAEEAKPSVPVPYGAAVISGRIAAVVPGIAVPVRRIPVAVGPEAKAKRTLSKVSAMGGNDDRSALIDGRQPEPRVDRGCSPICYAPERLQAIPVAVAALEGR